MSLDRLAGYVLKTREAILKEGHPVLAALGVSLPALRLPRDTVFATRVKEAIRGHASAWKKEFGWAAKNRACYLLKQTPSQLLLGEEDLVTAFEKARDSIPAGLHETVAAFVRAPSGWNEPASQLMAWSSAVSRDKDGRIWRELDTRQLLAHREFLEIAAH